MSDWPPDVPPGELPALQQMASELSAARPTPDGSFRSGLGHAVAAETQRRHVRPRPARLWATVGLLMTTGAVVLAAAAAQI